MTEYRPGYEPRCGRPSTAQELLARLRAHCAKPWRTCNCDPAAGNYCWELRSLAAEWYELRRDEVYAERLARRAR